MKGAEALRVDKWLFHARFFKTRSLAARQVQAGKLRINSQPQKKPASLVRPGDVLTFAQGRSIRVIEILALGHRRGPAAEAQALYRDLAPPEFEKRETPPPPPGLRPPGAGRPTKKQRREIDRFLRED